MRKTRNSATTKLLLQHKSFDSEHDKLRDKHLSGLKWEKLVPVKDSSRRKSEDSKHSPINRKSYGFFKFRSSVDASSSLYSIKVFLKFHNYGNMHGHSKHLQYFLIGITKHFVVYNRALAFPTLVNIYNNTESILYRLHLLLTLITIIILLDKPALCQTLYQV